MICIAIDNGSDTTVGGSYYSAHQAVGEFAFIANARLGQVYLGTLIRRLNVSL